MQYRKHQTNNTPSYNKLLYLTLLMYVNSQEYFVITRGKKRLGLFLHTFLTKPLWHFMHLELLSYFGEEGTWSRLKYKAFNQYILPKMKVKDLEQKGTKMIDLSCLKLHILRVHMFNVCI